MISILADVGVSLFLMLFLDFVWLSLIMQDYYSYYVFRIQGEELELNYTSVILCYLSLIFGLNYFVIKEIKQFNVLKILSLSIPFGIVTFGTYDFTSASVLKNFELITAFIDIIWGITLSSITALLTIYFRRFLNMDTIEAENDNYFELK